MQCLYSHLHEAGKKNTNKYLHKHRKTDNYNFITFYNGISKEFMFMRNMNG